MPEVCQGISGRSSENWAAENAVKSN